MNDAKGHASNVIPLRPANTRIDYLFRDDANIKVHATIIVAGALNEVQQHELRATLSDVSFIPEQVGMEGLQQRLIRLVGFNCDAMEQSWHEIEQISITDEPINFSGTALELLDRFKAAVWEPQSLLSSASAGPGV